MPDSSIREERIKRRILQRKNSFASGLRQSNDRDYKALAPAGRPLPNNPDKEASARGKAIGMSKYRQSLAYRKKF